VAQVGSLRVDQYVQRQLAKQPMHHERMVVAVGLKHLQERGEELELGIPSREALDYKYTRADACTGLEMCCYALLPLPIKQC